jgi:hypothetical protein
MISIVVILVDSSIVPVVGLPVLLSLSSLPVYVCGTCRSCAQLMRGNNPETRPVLRVSTYVVLYVIS